MTLPVDEDIDARELRTHGASWAGGTGDPAVLGGALALENGTCVDNLPARDAKNDPTLAPHPLSRSFACIAVASMPVGGGAAVGGGELVSTLPSSTSDLEITVPEPVLVLPTERDEADRCTNRPLTPSTALKKFVEPAVRVREIASFVGASCCSSLSS